MKVTVSVHPNNLGAQRLSRMLPLPRWFAHQRGRTNHFQRLQRCHNLLAVQEENPKILTNLGLQ